MQFNLGFKEGKSPLKLLGFLEPSFSIRRSGNLAEAEFRSLPFPTLMGGHSREGGLKLGIIIRNIFFDGPYIIKKLLFLIAVRKTHEFYPGEK